MYQIALKKNKNFILSSLLAYFIDYERILE